MATGPNPAPAPAPSYLKEWPEELVMEVLVARLSRLAGTAARR